MVCGIFCVFFFVCYIRAIQHGYVCSLSVCEPKGLVAKAINLNVIWFTATLYVCIHTFYTNIVCMWRSHIHSYTRSTSSSCRSSLLFVWFLLLYAAVCIFRLLFHCSLLNRIFLGFYRLHSCKNKTYSYCRSLSHSLSI